MKDGRKVGGNSYLLVIRSTNKRQNGEKDAKIIRSTDSGPGEI